MASRFRPRGQRPPAGALQQLRPPTMRAPDGDCSSWRGGRRHLFYSRQIGLADGLTVPIKDGERLTGRLGRLSLGALNVRVGDRPSSGAQATTFSVLRLKRDFLRRSSIGAIVTRRSLRQNGTGTNEAYGVDAMNFDLKGATRHPSCRSIRQSAATIMLLPACDAGPSSCGSSTSPVEVHSRKRVATQRGVTEHFFIPAIQKIFDAYEHVDGWS